MPLLVANTKKLKTRTQDFILDISLCKSIPPNFLDSHIVERNIIRVFCIFYADITLVGKLNDSSLNKVDGRKPYMEDFTCMQSPSTWVATLPHP